MGRISEEILNLIVKEGWFLPVTPGSKSNSWRYDCIRRSWKKSSKVGCFSNYILNLKLLNNKGKIIVCIKKKFFLLQIYSRKMGLTGIIYTAKIKLKKIMSDIILRKIKNYNLKETLKCINSSKIGSTMLHG